MTDRRAEDLAHRAPADRDKAEALHALGWVMLRQGFPRRALALFRTATRYAPPSSAMLRATAVAELEAGLPEDAARSLSTLRDGLEGAGLRETCDLLHARAIRALRGRGEGKGGSGTDARNFEP